jgi:hypothetical protein
MAQKLCQTHGFVQHRVAIAGESTKSLQLDAVRPTVCCIAYLLSNFVFFGGPPVANLRLFSQEGRLIRYCVLRVSVGCVPVSKRGNRMRPK